MNQAEEFEQLRPLLFAIAYRIRAAWRSRARSGDLAALSGVGGPARSVKAYLAATVTRISIDVLRSARSGGRSTPARSPSRC